MKRTVFITLNFCCLFATQFSWKLLQSEDQVGINNLQYLVLTAFTFVMLALTFIAVQSIKKLHEVKVRDGYKFDANDTKFEKVSDIAALSFFCMIAAILCGCTGIAGGMVLGPLFLRYNMIPQVMSGTNQYITMIASISVAIQFIYLGEMIFSYALIFGGLTLVAAYIGITAVNIYVKKSGK